MVEEKIAEKAAQLSPEDARALLEGKNRLHNETLGRQWFSVLGQDPQKLISQVIGTVINAGGTRPAWQWTAKEKDYVLMAWPKESPLRASVLASGPHDGKLEPIDASPLLEGLPNGLEVAEVYPWKAGAGANVAAFLDGSDKPMWFYDPLYVRDQQDLTPGVIQSFSIAGLAFGIRKALLDDLSVTQGELFEAHAAQWLEEHPGKTRLDVPPIQIPLKGRHLIMPGESFCEYQIRATVQKVEDCALEKMEAKILYLRFPGVREDSLPLTLPLYAIKTVLGDYVPAEGDEIDAYIWLQGRVIDMDQVPQN